MSNENESEQQEERVVLLVGSCGLDRLLTVTKYPNPDAKVRTTAYHEMGGGKMNEKKREEKKCERRKQPKRLCNKRKGGKKQFRFSEIVYILIFSSCHTIPPPNNNNNNN